MLNRFLTVVFIIFGFSPFCFAQEGSSKPGSLRLPELIQSAREHNPDIIAAHADWIAAKRRILIDSSLPDPEVGFDLMGSDVETRVGPQMQRLAVSQEVPFPVKLVEKAQAASQEARAAQAKFRAIERDIANQLSKFYYELYFVDSSLSVIEEVNDILKKFEGAAQARYANLSGTQRDAAKAQAEVSMSLEKTFTLKQRRESVAAMILTLLNRDPMSELGRPEAPARPVLNQTLIELINLAVKNRPEIKAQEAILKQTQSQSNLAKLEWIPDLNVGFEYTWVGSGMTVDPDDGRDSWMFPLRFRVPLWLNKNIPAVQEAQKKVEANEARLLSAKNNTFYEVKDAYYRYDTALKIAELYETAVVPQAKLALSSDQAGYESGKMDFLNLLDSERVYLNARLSQIQFFTEALKAYADLEHHVGLDLENKLEGSEGKKS